ncbi:MAG: tRNA dihydrouridine(20/20a) synthase DusA [Bdellovibrionales bacterium]
MNKDFEISVAPMMDWTDRHCRYFHRLISKHAKLYTEMITTGAILHGDAERFLRFDKMEHPVALQLGGSEADDLARSAEIGSKHGYDEINLNCGCPSDRVQSGRFGACLMLEPDHVADCIDAMITASDAPVSVKCRIGIDDQDSFEFLDRFVDKIGNKGCETFIIHARSAWLKGLSPKENRDVPPLNYQRVYDVKEKYPQLRIILNGGVTAMQQIDAAHHLDGVMIGREAYQNPYWLAEIERKIFGNDAILGRDKIARNMMDYIDQQAATYQTPVKSITRHMMGLFHHQPGAKHWRRALSEYPHEDDATSEAITKALADRLAALKIHAETRKE